MRDLGSTLAVARPQSAAEWIVWHARRDAARRVIAKIRVYDREAERVDPVESVAVRDLLTHLLGLDPDSEAELISRWT